MATTRTRYRAAGIRQVARLNGALIGCTDTSFAMAVDHATLGGLVVTEKRVRQLSDEAAPDPHSPGLNLPQLVAVAGKLGVAFEDRTGDSFADLLRCLAYNKPVVAQLWYALIGGSAIGHAVYVRRSWMKRCEIVDPVHGTYTWVDHADLKAAMTAFAKRSSLEAGLRFGAGAAAPFIAVNQKPQTHTSW